MSRCRCGNCRRRKKGSYTYPPCAERIYGDVDYPLIPEAPEPREAPCFEITTRELWLIFIAYVLFHTLIFGVAYYVAAH